MVEADNSPDKDGSKNHRRFWPKQPVVQPDSEMSEIEKKIGSLGAEVKGSASIRSIPYKLPENFNWHQLEMDDSSISKLSTFLCENYLESDSGHFSLMYTADLLKFVLTCPSNNPEYNICIANKENLIIGFISGKQISTKVGD
ncbi:MAG: glycylpeptide N-tetradecanoyltransferase, partial [Paramarteilia canceri]